MSQNAIYFGGSRNLNSTVIVDPVVIAAITTEAAVHVGCAAGADALVSTLVPGPQLHVFAIGNQAGRGFWAGSQTISELLYLARHGAAVHWLAGGALAVPLRARLIRRSIAAFQGCSAAVFFLSSGQPSGSLAVAGKAAAAGLPVFAFTLYGNSPAAPRGQAGRWGVSSFLGFSCWQWQPAQKTLF